MLTRLRHTAGNVRFAVGYDPDLATYYLEAAPPGTPVDPDDPDEGLVTLRGRTPRDLPDMSALVAALTRYGLHLPAEHLRALAAAAERSAVTTPRRHSSLPAHTPDRSVPQVTPLTGGRRRAAGFEHGGRR